MSGGHPRSAGRGSVARQSSQATPRGPADSRRGRPRHLGPVAMARSRAAPPDSPVPASTACGSPPFEPTAESHIPEGGDRAPIAPYLDITQTYWALAIRQFTRESTSDSQALFWDRRNGAPWKTVVFLYDNRSTSRASDRGASSAPSQRGPPSPHLPRVHQSAPRAGLRTRPLACACGEPPARQGPSPQTGPKRLHVSLPPPRDSERESRRSGSPRPSAPKILM